MNISRRKLGSKVINKESMFYFSKLSSKNDEIIFILCTNQEKCFNFIHFKFQECLSYSCWEQELQKRHDFSALNFAAHKHYKQYLQSLIILKKRTAYAHYTLKWERKRKSKKCCHIRDLISVFELVENDSLLTLVTSFRGAFRLKHRQLVRQ